MTVSQDVNRVLIKSWLRCDPGYHSRVLIDTRAQMHLVDVIRLTNRFHVAVRLFSNRSQMTPKCGKNKKVAHEAIAECVTDVLTTF